MSDGKVIDFPEKSNKEDATTGEEKPRRSKKKPTLSPGTVQTYLTQFLDGKPLPFARDIPKFDTRFKVYRKNPSDAPMILEYIKENNTVRKSNIEYVAARLNEIIQYFTEGPQEALNVNYRRCKELVEAWAAMTSDFAISVDKWPNSIGFKSDSEPCFFRHDFDPIVPDHFPTRCPIVYSGMTRMSNGQAFLVRTGSLFDPDADRKQAVWLYGPPDGGKSFFGDLIALCVGGEQGAFRVNPSAMSSKHWKEALVGKRVLIAPEASVKFINKHGDEFKSLTGDEWHACDPKFEKMTQIKMQCMAYYLTNDEPAFDRDPGVLNRMIVCYLASIPKDRRISPKKLMPQVMQEIPYFIGYCQQLYAEYGNRFIESDEESKELLETAVNSAEMEMQALFSMNFKHSPGSFLLSEEVTKQIKVFTDYRVSVRAFQCFLRDKYGCKFAKNWKEAKRLGLDFQKTYFVSDLALR